MKVMPMKRSRLLTLLFALIVLARFTPERRRIMTQAPDAGLSVIRLYSPMRCPDMSTFGLELRGNWTPQVLSARRVHQRQT
jgi:hypothetical protein